jgi:hypothetical protein
MRAEFSELQYAYACTRELEDGTWLIPPFGLPYFPSLYEEGTGDGYDVAFREGMVAPVFLQFKVPEALTKSTANEWHLFNAPYFRFEIYPASRSPQHNRLVDLSMSEPFTFYCAPAFFRYNNYRELHIKRKIVENSAFFPCAYLPKNSGDDVHHIVFSMTSCSAYWCSEPQEIKLLSGMVGLTEWCLGHRDVFDKVPNVVERIERLFADKVPAYDNTLDLQEGTQSDKSYYSKTYVLNIFRHIFEIEGISTGLLLQSSKQS